MMAAVIAVCAGPAAASDPGRSKPAVAATSTPAPAPDADAVTHHTIVVNGSTLAYTARAGTITLRNDDEQPALRMFYVAYTLDGATPENRPLTFVYNGGPGSSTMWLHLGSFGPVRVAAADGGPITGPAPAPYRIVTNDDTLLDKTDLVFIDMPTAGFGRLVAPATPKDFYSVDKDVAAFGSFIRGYITTFGRWNSPKFLYGESYGTMRSGALVNHLQQNLGISMTGVVLQSSYLNAGIDYIDNGPPIGGGSDWAYILYLPTEAATAWYHKALANSPPDLVPFLHDVEHFAMTEYADALAKGAQLGAPEFNDVVAKLHRYTGLSEQYIRNANLRVPYWRLQNELLRDRHSTVGRIDSRFEIPALDRTASSPNWDPTDAAIDGPFTVAVNQYLRTDLNYDTALDYRTNVYALIGRAGGWDNTHRGNPTTNVLPDIAEAMTYNPRLRIFQASGYYDFATPYFETVYALNHLGIVPSLQSHISYGFYPAGHMIYLESSSIRALHDDLERWYDATLTGR